MGFAVYLAFFSLLLEGLSIFLCFLKNKDTRNPLALILAILFSLYSYTESLRLEVERIILSTPKLSSLEKEIKILHLSDVHFGPVLREDKLKLIKEIWLREKPDLVVSTGDLVDGNAQRLLFLAEELRKLEAPLGKFAVLGNHEFYRGVSQSLWFMERAGFKVLRGEWIDLGDLVVAGVDDKACLAFQACQGEVEEKRLLASLPSNRFVIFLKHRPDLEENLFDRLDLMLSGHLHGGLYKPVGLILRYIYLNDRGFKKVRSAYVHVSKGIGTGGPPMRFLTPPDVGIILLKPSSLPPPK